MKEDIQRTMNVFCGLTILSLILVAGVSGIFSGMMGLVIIVLIPSMHILKVSPLRTNSGVKKQISFFEICIITLFLFGMCRIIAYALISIPWISKIDNTLVIPEYSSQIVQLLVIIFALVVEELLYRGILLNKLRKHGDLFAVAVSSIIFGISHGARFYTMIAGLFIGILYVISDSIIAPIVLHALYNLGAIYFEKLVLKTNIRAVLFYLAICIICLAIMLIDKRFKRIFMDFRNKYKEEAGLNKGKYSAAFKSEVFLVFVLIMGVMAALTFSFLFKN